MNSSTWLIILICGIVFVIVCLVLAFRNLGKKRLLNDNPTSRTQGVFIGLTELQGTAESEKSLVSYIAGVPCVQYTYQIEEHWSRTITETYRDAKGNTRTRTRTESGWKNVARGGESVPFYLKDDTGILRILPEGAKIQGRETFSQIVNRGDPLYFGKCPAGEVAHSSHRRRFRETALPLHAELYIVGRARERQDIVAAEIAYDKTSPIFLISTGTEKQVSSRYNIQIWLWAIVGFFITIGIALTWHFTQAGPDGNVFLIYLVATAGYFVVFLLGWIWTVYNSFVNLHQRVLRGWSQVDIQLKRRNDLIPNLVSAVEGYRSHEKDTQVLLSDLRTQLSATPPGFTGPDYHGIAPVLKTTIENYPDLKTSEQFLKLQKSLAETEQRIALARDYYNEITTFYNSRLEMVPDRFIGSLARLQPRALMAASGFERASLDIKL